jgi:hypothetical protein
MLDRCCDGNPCCGGDPAYLLLQIGIICVLLFLIGTSAVVQHSEWFAAVPAVTQSAAER